MGEPSPKEIEGIACAFVGVIAEGFEVVPVALLHQVQHHRLSHLSFLLLAKCYIKNKKSKECKQVITQAISQFAGTPEEVHVMLTNAMISVESGDIKKAMSILKAVKADSPYFVESRKLLADIHLEHLKNRKGYAKCYY